VELDIDPAQREEFHNNMLKHSAATLEGEPGCLAFDVFVDARNPNRYALFELYADEKAVDEHRFSKQLAVHRSEVDPAILSRVIWVIDGQIDESNFRGADG
jgi:quinol monooxygenase YgiN